MNLIFHQSVSLAMLLRGGLNRTEHMQMALLSKIVINQEIILVSLFVWDY
jgi:hypothetical protein